MLRTSPSAEDPTDELSSPTDELSLLLLVISAGVVTLRQDHKICEKDKPLTPEQAQILVCLVVCHYHNLL